MLFTSLSLNYTAEANQATRDQVRLSEQGQITDRFSRATDQLGQAGTDRLSIRLGGIYALERVMRDSPADEPTVIEVLCAFIRTQAPRPNDQRGGASEVPASPEDVRAAVTVLGRRPHPEAAQNWRLDFSNTQLSLPHISLPKANLAGANLTGANLAGAILIHANLADTKLIGANLTGVDLAGRKLAGSPADIDHMSVELTRVNLTQTDLTRATLIRANLTGVDLNDADLSDADLSDADLTHANLTRADLSGANLSGANLSGARGLSRDQLKEAITDGHTRLPSVIR